MAEPPGPTSPRSIALDVLKGIAIAGVVVYHSLDKAQGIGLSIGPVGTAIESALALFHVHLFMFVSGLLYGLQRERHEAAERSQAYWPFLGKKALRLLVPCVTVTALDWALRPALGHWADQPGVPLYHAVFFSYKRFWFLQALFVLFAVAPILPLRPRAAVPILVGAYVLSVFFWGAPEFLSVASAIQMAPYFLLGYAIGLHGEAALRWRAPWSAQLATAALAVTATAAAITVLRPSPEDPVNLLHQVVRRIAATGNVAFLWMSVVSLVRTPPASLARILATVGRCSMAIYLLHVPAMIPAGVLPRTLGVTQWVAFSVVGTALGLAAPWLLERAVLRKAPLLGAIVLGAPLRQRPGRQVQRDGTPQAEGRGTVP